MTDDALLLAWMADALEPGQAARVAQQVKRNPLLQARMLELAPRLQEPVPTAQWRIPPPGVRGGTRGVFLQARLPAVMGDDTLRPGDRFQVRIAAPEDASDYQIVVLRQTAGVWEVVHPEVAEDELRLTDLPMEPGHYVLDLAAHDQTGAQRWAVALLHDNGPQPDWNADDENRWTYVMTGIAAGTVAVTSVSVLVQAA